MILFRAVPTEDFIPTATWFSEEDGTAMFETTSEVEEMETVLMGHEDHLLVLHLDEEGRLRDVQAHLPEEGDSPLPAGRAMPGYRLVCDGHSQQSGLPFTCRRGEGWTEVDFPDVPAKEFYALGRGLTVGLNFDGVLARLTLRY